MGRVREDKIHLFFFIFYLLAFAAGAAPEPFQEEKEELLVAKDALEEGFYDTSLRLFSGFSQKYPLSVLADEANLSIGQCYFYQKEYPKAIAHWTKLLAAKNTSAIQEALFFWIAEAYFKANDLARADDFYEKLLSEYPSSSYARQALYSLGWCLFEQGEYLEAEERFAEFKSKYPRDALSSDTEVKIAECLYNLKSYPKLKEYIRQLRLTEAPKDPAGDKQKAILEFYLAESCFYLGDYSCAIYSYTQAFDVLLDNSFRNLIYLGLGWSYLKSNDFIKAKASFDALKDNQGDGKARESALLGEALLLGLNSEFPQSIEAYTKLLRQAKNPEVRFEALVGKAEALYALGDYSSAIAAYQEAAQSVNDEGAKISSLAKAAEVYEKSGNAEKAISIYAEILKNYPECHMSVLLRHSLGVSLLNSQRYPEAQEVFKSLLVQYPHSEVSEEAYFYLGKAYYEAGDWTRSWLHFKEFASKYTSGLFKAQVSLGEGLSLKALGRFQEAYDIFKKTLTFNPQARILAQAEFEMADCLYYLERPDEALNRLELLRSKYSDPEITGVILFRLAERYFEEDKLGLSRRYLSELISAKPKAPLLSEAYYLLGIGYGKEEKYTQAKEVFNKIIGNKSHFYLKIGDFYRDAGNFEEALFYYRESLLEAGADRLRVKFKIAECLEGSGRTSEALVEYLDISEDNILMVKGLLRCAKIYENQENWQSAIGVYERISSLETEESRFARERIEIIKGKIF